MKHTFRGTLAVLTISVAALGASSAQAAIVGVPVTSRSVQSVGGLQVVSGHVRPGFSRAPLVGALPPWKTLHLAIGLPARNSSQLQAIVADSSNPLSLHYRRHLTPNQIQAWFSPTVSDYQSVLAFARNAHFTITRTYAHRLVIDADATVSDIQQAFHLTMQTRLRPDGSVFYAPSNEPALALRTPILHIEGLDNYKLPKPTLSSAAPIRARPHAGQHGAPDLTHGPGGTLAGPDFRDAYAPGATQTGINQCLGLFEIDSSFFPSDIATYQLDFGLPALVPQKVLLDGYSGVPVVSKGETETALDIEVGQAMSPNLANIVVYEGDNHDDILAAMASAPYCNQVSASWNFSVDSTSQLILEVMAAQGQSFYVSSGDTGGFTSDTGDDRDLSDETVVGGTVLNLSDGYHWQSEIAWPGSSGGFESSQYVPPFQLNLQISGSGIATARAIPDVAAVAANTFIVADNGVNQSVAGTSIATPLWASFTALINQQAQSVGQPPLGYANPTLYNIARSGLYSANFHDITFGNNGVFNAGGGFDLVTGWGSPKVKLISVLNPPPTLNYTQLQFVVYTGSDNLRADSDLQVAFTGIGGLTLPFCLMRSNNGSPSDFCTGNVPGDVNGTQGWDSWSTQTLTYVNRFSNWTWSGNGTMTLQMWSHNNGFETNDNYDIQAMSVVLSNPKTGTSVTLFNSGNWVGPQNPGLCYWRFKPTGSPPTIAQTFKLLPKHTPSDGCPSDF